MAEADPSQFTPPPFKDGAQIRLVSYLDADLLLGLGIDQWYASAMRRRAPYDEHTLFRVRWAVAPGFEDPTFGGFSLGNANGELGAMKLDRDERAVSVNGPLGRSLDSRFDSVDTVLRAEASEKGPPWLRLTYAWTRALDVAGGHTADLTPIYWFHKNGGDNQIWRAEVVTEPPG